MTDLGSAGKSPTTPFYIWKYSLLKGPFDQHGEILLSAASLAKSGNYRLCGKNATSDMVIETP